MINIQNASQLSGRDVVDVLKEPGVIGDQIIVSAAREQDIRFQHLGATTV